MAHKAMTLKLAMTIRPDRTPRVSSWPQAILPTPLAATARPTIMFARLVSRPKRSVSRIGRKLKTEKKAHEKAANKAASDHGPGAAAALRRSLRIAWPEGAPPGAPSEAMKTPA